MSFSPICVIKNKKKWMPVSLFFFLNFIFMTHTFFTCVSAFFKKNLFLRPTCFSHFLCHHACQLGCAQFYRGGFFFKFTTEPIEIGVFFIIGTDAHHLRSVFRPIAVQFFAVSLFGLVGLKY